MNYKLLFIHHSNLKLFNNNTKNMYIILILNCICKIY